MDSTPSAASCTSSETVAEGPVAYTIASVPVIKTTGSERFVTELSFQFTKAPTNHNVVVTCSLQVEAKIWGLQSTLEPYMLSEAKKQLTEFVPFLTAYFREHSGAPMLSSVGASGPLPLLPSPRTVPAHAPGNGATRCSSTVPVSGMMPRNSPWPSQLHRSSPVAGEGEHVAASRSTSPSAPASPKASPSAPGSAAGGADSLSLGSRSSSEHFYDALEEVPKGVRAAVQIFEVRRPHPRLEPPSLRLLAAPAG